MNTEIKRKLQDINARLAHLRDARRALNQEVNSIEVTIHNLEQEQLQLLGEVYEV